GGALVVVAQAPVVQVDAAHHGGGIVADEDLGVDEAGGVLVDLHPLLDELPVVAVGQGEGGLLVRDAGNDDPHVHPPLGGVGQGGEHVIVQNQVGGGDVDVPLGPVEDVHVHHLAHVLLVHGDVPVGHDPAPGRNRGGGVQVLQVVRPPSRRHVPQLEEHQGEAPHRLAGDHDGGVLPVAEAPDPVDVLIRQVDA